MVWDINLMARSVPVSDAIALVPVAKATSLGLDS
jgi:hypothetical protein